MEFVIDDMKPEDAEEMAWVGRLHMDNVLQQLERRGRGETDYLVARDAEGEPVAKGGVDYTVHEAAGMIWQMATREDVQSRGLGRALVAELEARIAARGLGHAVIGVETFNHRAEALYRRLGYRDWSSEESGWDQEDEDGNVYRYETTCLLLRKSL